MPVKKLLKSIPILGPIASALYGRLFGVKRFTSSNEYWIDRYNSGGNSGDGSYNELAQFKAGVINDFVSKNEVETVVEFGCGDGNQLKLSRYPSYTGFDISPAAISLCKKEFAGDPGKDFRLITDYKGETADLSMSLDVIFHVVEDEEFVRYMERLFNSARRFVLIYSSDTDENAKGQAAHVKHRKFTRWVEEKQPGWRLKTHIPNRFPFKGDTKTGSFADFFIYEKV